MEPKPINLAEKLVARWDKFDGGQKATTIAGIVLGVLLSLPFVVFGLVWSVNPGYLDNFFSDERLMVAGIGGLVWMSIGVAMMAKMINFEI